MSTILKVKIKGTTYCYYNTSYWDKDEKTSKSKRILIGKIDPATGEMVPTEPRGGRRGKHADAYDAAVGDNAGGVIPTGDGSIVPLDNDVYRKQCEELKVQLLNTEQKLAEAEAERDTLRRKLSRLAEAIRKLPV